MSKLQSLTDFLKPVTILDKEGKQYTIVPQCLCGDNVAAIRGYLETRQEKAAKTLLHSSPPERLREVASQLFEDMQKTAFNEIASLLDPVVIRIVLERSIEGIRDKPEDERNQIVNAVMQHNSVPALCEAIIQASGELTVKNCISLLSELRNKQYKLSNQSGSAGNEQQTPVTSTPTSSATAVSPPERLEVPVT